MIKKLKSLLAFTRTVTEKLTAIESLLQRLPEIQAAVHFKMQDEYEAAKFSGMKATDIWEIAQVSQR